MNDRLNRSLDDLLDLLIREGHLQTPAIIDAFRRIDRKFFVLPTEIDRAYENIPLPIGFGQTISQPLTVAFMLEKLAPQQGEKILEIGAGSGWLTALLAELVGKKGRIVAIELIPDLVEMAKKNVGRFSFIDKGVVDILLADGSKGYKKEAPYDKIISGAAVTKDLPISWKEQLKFGGRIISPIDDRIDVVDKIRDSLWRKQVYPGFSFVPLISSQ